MNIFKLNKLLSQAQKRIDELLEMNHKLAYERDQEAIMASELYKDVIDCEKEIAELKGESLSDFPEITIHLVETD